ncbi:ribonuclease domain-containing protein [Nitrincola tapanii]|uniref:Ribonuclease n=1 Tax=Nitrincola tapanii TaxID=1708751 RepID=A0A5A9W845_9GAMM|nr:ribonuclease domain-containing protein [Nitrincola tapanii]KAA0876288.1 ribonuclease [Nitrincola tapanii]
MKKILPILALLFAVFALQNGHFNHFFNSESSVQSAQTSLSAQEQELLKTLERIQRGGPFPYDRDGITFENREKRLPLKAPFYYREYTVDTPGLSHRGPRRVVTGGNPPEVFYYTEDHYRSFTRINGHTGQPE